MTESVYKFAHIDITEIVAAARKGLMVADSHYFAWSAKQQELFRATMSEKARQKVQCVLIDCLFGIKCSPQELSNTWDDIPFPNLNVINWAILLTQGVGEDYIYLNEFMAEGLESQLEELQSRWYIYQSERWCTLSKMFSKLPSAVFTFDQDSDQDPHRYFIFNNVSTLKQIRWQHFLADCTPLMTDFSVMEEQLEKEIGDGPCK